MTRAPLLSTREMALLADVVQRHSPELAPRLATLGEEQLTRVVCGSVLH
jgi:hypothetical protein